MSEKPTSEIPARFVRIPSIAERKLGRDYSAPIRLDPRVLDQMQQTIKTLAAAYSETLGAQIASLLPLIDEAGAGAGDARSRLYAVAHDVRGLAGTFGMPVVGDFARSLCDYMEKRINLDSTIVRFHVEAMNDAVNDPAPDTAIANETLRSLERLIHAAGSDAKSFG
ncbi:MAG TPA: hypothetical protein VF449_10910 [Parvibaculum sp.]